MSAKAKKRRRRRGIPLRPWEGGRRTETPPQPSIAMKWFGLVRGGRRAPRPGEIVVGGPETAGRVEIERVLGRNGAGWRVLGLGAEPFLVLATRTPGVWTSSLLAEMPIGKT